MAVDAYFISLSIAECFLYTFHLSILLLLIVKRKNNFEGAFYNIFRIVLVADFLSYNMSVIDVRFSQIPYLYDFYQSSTFLPAFMFLIIPFLVTIQFFGRLLMAFNRFTLIWFPLSHQRFWRRQWYTVLLLLIPFLTICWRLHIGARYIFIGSNLVAVYSYPNFQPIMKAIASIIYISTTLAAAIFNGLSFGMFCYKKQKSVNYQLNEQHLLFMSIAILFAQLGRASYPVQQYLFPTNESLIAFFSSILSLLNDALALSGSISFFLLSKIARKEYASFYFCRNYSSVVMLKSSAFAKPQTF